MSNPCHHDCDWTDGDEPVLEDAGCCSPLPVRITCEAPVLPVPECDEEPATLTFDEDTESFVATVGMFTKACSPWLDKNSDPWLALIA